MARTEWWSVVLWAGLPALAGLAGCGGSEAAARAAPPGMVWIAGGTFAMGSEDNEADERPVHEVEVSGFWLDRHEVTNAEFAKFVEAESYVTVAERPLNPAEFPGVPPAELKPGSLVFTPPDDAVSLDDFAQWWTFVPGACWQRPEGAGSDLSGRENHPVVHVAWEDATAYARWAGKRLPTEAEWEFAARGGLAAQTYVWGNEQKPGGSWRANIWQGTFPTRNECVDGFATTAPVGSFAANGYGLHDMSGNVWEWCADWYHAKYYGISARRDPRGPERSWDPGEPDVAKRVLRGGSYLCSDVYCTGYRPSARMKSSPDTGLVHSGFRCAR